MCLCVYAILKYIPFKVHSNKNVSVVRTTTQPKPFDISPICLGGGVSVNAATLLVLP